MSDFEMKGVEGADILNYLDDLAQLRISVFREFPYLYDGSTSYEEKYLKVYSENVGSFIALAIHHGRVVGAATGTPLINELDYVKQPFIQNGYAPEGIFYFGESVLQKEFRGRGLGWEFMNMREAHARKLKFEMATFCGVERPIDHPRKPAQYKPLDGFWRKAGFEPMGIYGFFTWQDLDEDSASPKKMNYWSKTLN
jgi:GNAT superfamily N-acetyltransferase